MFLPLQDTAFLSWWIACLKKCFSGTVHVKHLNYSWQLMYRAPHVPVLCLIFRSQMMENSQCQEHRAQVSTCAALCLPSSMGGGFFHSIKLEITNWQGTGLLEFPALSTTVISPQCHSSGPCCCCSTPTNATHCRSTLPVASLSCCWWPPVSASHTADYCSLLLIITVCSSLVHFREKSFG